MTKVPRVINGRFSVLRTVGVGGFGQVLLAYDREVEQLCAVKLLHAARLIGFRDF
jgi:serine/threonine protein kinase